jgi:excisionase family DNA binding protein
VLERLLTYKEVAEILSVPVKRVEELGRRELIPTVRLGRQRRVSRKALEQFISVGGMALPGGWKFQAE